MIQRLVLVRHGQSVWNRENLFTGWTDVDLSEKGLEECRHAARLLKEGGYTFDEAFTSVLKRAIRTLWIILDELDLMWIQVRNTWRLNERHYGALQGMNKSDTAKQYGENQVHLWRRGYEVRPPALELTDKRHPRFDPRYQGIGANELPATESLKDTLSRVLPCWRHEIAPRLKEGKRILISAHGNSIRSLVKFFDDVSDDDIMNVNIPTGFPLIYEFDRELKAVNHFYLGDRDTITSAMDSVKHQTKWK